MMITAAELETNLDKFLDMIQNSNEDIIITKNGKYIAKLSNPKNDAMNYLKGLCKNAPNDASIDDAKFERITTKHAKDL